MSLVTRFPFHDSFTSFSLPSSTIAQAGSGLQCWVCASTHRQPNLLDGVGWVWVSRLGFEGGRRDLCVEASLIHSLWSYTLFIYYGQHEEVREQGASLFAALARHFHKLRSPLSTLAQADNDLRYWSCLFFAAFRNYIRP